MSNFEKKEQNLNQLIDKLNSISLSYSQPNYEIEKIKRLNEDYEFQMNHSILTAELPDENMTQLISQLFKLDTPKSFTVEELPVEDTMKAFFANPTEFI